MNPLEYKSYRGISVDSASTRQDDNYYFYNSNGNYPVSQYGQPIEVKTGTYQDKKHTIEVTEFKDTTISEIERKSHENENRKSLDIVRLRNPLIKERKKTRLSKRTIWTIVIVSFLVLLAIIGGIIYVYKEIMVCNGYKATGGLYIRRKSCKYAPYFKPSSKQKLTHIYIDNNSFTRAKSFHVDGLQLLRYIQILEGSFTRVGITLPDTLTKDVNRHFGVLNCPQLTSIWIGSYSFAEWDGEFILKNLPALEVLVFGSSSQGYTYNFYHNILSLKGTQALFQLQL